MHGEYKTPGGKLVIVDFAVRDGRFVAMEVTGDFFLYPDEAFDAIVRTLNGLPTSLPADEIAARIQHAVGTDVTFLGFSPEAIGIAIQRAMSESSSE